MFHSFYFLPRKIITYNIEVDLQNILKVNINNKFNVTAVYNKTYATNLLSIIRSYLITLCERK